MKTVAFNDYIDKGALEFCKDQLREFDIHCCAKKEVIEPNTARVIGCPDGQILVLHNNSDVFGDNITNEGSTSLDGVIGSYTLAFTALGKDAAIQVR